MVSRIIVLAAGCGFSSTRGRSPQTNQHTVELTFRLAFKTKTPILSFNDSVGVIILSLRGFFYHVIISTLSLRFTDQGSKCGT